MKRSQLGAALLCLAAASPSAIAAPQPADGETILIGVAPGGEERGHAHFGDVDVSGNGRFIVFTSDGGRLVRGDTNGVEDAFLRDRKEGTTTRISVTNGGEEVSKPTRYVSISPNGRYVVMGSWSNSLTPGDKDGDPDLFLYNRFTKKVQLVSLGDADTKVQGAYRGEVSNDGRYVTFEGWHRNGAHGNNIWLRDREIDETRWLSPRFDIDSPEWSQESTDPKISGNGETVAFLSHEPLIKGDKNGSDDIYAYHVASQRLRIATQAKGRQIHGNCHYGHEVTFDGRLVVFSCSRYLEEGDESMTYVRNLETSTTRSVPRPYEWPELYSPDISADGRYVSYSTSSPPKEDGTDRPCSESTCSDVFITDRHTGEVVMVSIAADGTLADWGGGGPVMSDDARIVAFSSYSTELVEGGSKDDDHTDVFARLNPL